MICYVEDDVSYRGIVDFINLFISVEQGIFISFENERGVLLFSITSAFRYAYIQQQLVVKSIY